MKGHGFKEAFLTPTPLPHVFFFLVLARAVRQIAKVMQSFPGQSGIVYCLSRKDCEKVRRRENTHERLPKRSV